MRKIKFVSVGKIWFCQTNQFISITVFLLSNNEAYNDLIPKHSALNIFYFNVRSDKNLTRTQEKPKY